MPLRIVLADDHLIVVNAVRRVLEADGHEILAVASSTSELLETLARTSCDLLITDFSMPGDDNADGLPMLALIRRRSPALPVLVLTMITNPAVLQAILDTGVRGLINKADALSELAIAVRATSRGRRYVSKASHRLLARSGHCAAVPAATLSPRETEVIRLFASGMTVTDIARQLNRSVKTISTQKQEAMAKLGLKNDFEIYGYAREHGMLS